MTRKLKRKTKKMKTNVNNKYNDIDILNEEYNGSIKNKYSNIEMLDEEYDNLMKNKNIIDNYDNIELLNKEYGNEEYLEMEPNYPSQGDFSFEGGLKKKKYKIPVNRKVRIYCDGVYDLFHYGHSRSLYQAKNLFPNVHLIVGVSSDKDTLRFKGKTVLSAKERVESVKHCKHVDEVFEDCPWILTPEFLLKNNIDYVCHDDLPYSSKGQGDIYAEIKKIGRFIPSMRTGGISTSGIITMIVKDYHEYVRRNLERGVTGKELNIGFMVEKKFIIQKRFKELIEVKLQNEFDEIKNEIKIVLKYWEKRKDQVIRNFIEKFNKERNIPLWKKLVNVLRN
ncbi:Choline-phosphate cytidylyltransferase A [Spraguea lophii 42_110]|uniref:choline-phosphate cytidylyltransferase n=1 Tax=Spraguea lophii (strain 42_110) TaxID=1358809 RepID=S7W931_SPRLO|nr:Choline-phosphate cytidylyltransferase A [Spraguea lophii 42_110]